MNIAIGADHRGFTLKQAIIKHFKDHTFDDKGAHSVERSDYPAYAAAVTQEVAQKRAHAGILLCGSGIGMSIAANRIKGIYAGLCWSPAIATVAKENDGINVLVLPANFLTTEEAFSIIDAWLGARFKGGRHQERLSALDVLNN